MPTACATTPETQETARKAGAGVGQRTFAGLMYDGDTGLNYAGSRYYDAALGRFLSEDPAFLAVGDPQKLQQITKIDLQEYLASPQHLNSYSYAFNNPLVFIDEDGKFAMRTFGAGLFQVGKAALNGISVPAQAFLAGGALAAGYAPAAGLLTVSAIGNLDSAMADATNATTNLIGAFSDKEPTNVATQGPYRDMASQIAGDTMLFDGATVAGNVLSFTASDVPTFLSKAGPAYDIYKNARSAGVGSASLQYLASKVGGITYKALDVLTQVVTGGQGIPDVIENKTNLTKKPKK